MPTATYDYALIRLVPRVERGELLNVGVILFCRTRRFLDARIAADWPRIVALAPWIDPLLVQPHLDVILRICAGNDAGPIGELPQTERFHWLTAPRSTIVQSSSVYSGLCTDPAATLDSLFERMVRVTTIAPRAD
ncbi:MAG: DUF3037 domain-containing protein [Chloroflexaceae bacterium]|nr:DUF3037 domain-containing protein [Chloroflexaceae bacterium]NJO06959.1 DUF3037 domain-containing protein [Chloroflexaceae bacterium]